MLETMSQPWQPAICDHQHTELRLRTLSDGRPMYVYQCVTCGSAMRTIKKGAPEVLSRTEPPPPFDTELQTTYWRSRHEDQQRQREDIQREESAEWWRRYDAYLKTDAWRVKRARVLDRAGGMCEGCGLHYATQVHHLNYSHVGNEFLFELVAVCDECHIRLHDKA